MLDEEEDCKTVGLIGHKNLDRDSNSPTRYSYFSESCKLESVAFPEPYTLNPEPFFLSSSVLNCPTRPPDWGPGLNLDSRLTGTPTGAMSKCNGSEQ